MTEERPSPLTPLAKGSLVLALGAVVIFITGLLTGSLGPHRPGEETADMIAFTLCRIISPMFAFSGWLTGFITVLRRPGGLAWGAITVMVLILIFLLLLCYSAWRGAAAFHSNPLNS